MEISSSNSNNKWLPPLLLTIFLLPLVSLLLVVIVAADQKTQKITHTGSVEFLPGFEGALPFELETGYVGVDEGDDLQVFYYFIKSESNPKEDPIMIWITGGPGCSSLTGLIFEIGPLMFNFVDYNGSLPTLQSNPNSWTKMASIIFADLPWGAGFTYRKSALTSNFTDVQFANHAYQFMAKWLLDHPEFVSNQFYLVGDSYAGIIIPVIAQLISNGNEAGVEKYINLKGFILGNPLTIFADEGNYKIQFSHNMGLIPDELYESLKMSCGGEYRPDYIDPNNTQCLQYVNAYNELMDGICLGQILEPECGSVFLRPPNSLRKRRDLDETHDRVNELYNAKQNSLSPFMSCRDHRYSLAMYWANDESVQDALHIRKGFITEWKRCNKSTLTLTIQDCRPYHFNLSKKGYRTLIYSGDHDMVVPHQETQAWIKNLNYSIVDEWRSWRLHNRQVAGYTRTYSNDMTFATVKGGGHTAPEYRPEECFTMFKRWISNEPL